MHLKAGDAADSDTPLTEQQIKDFYNNPLVIRNLQENPDSSLLISQYRTHLWGTGYDEAINPQRLVGAGEALAAPLLPEQAYPEPRPKASTTCFPML